MPCHRDWDLQRTPGGHICAGAFQNDQRQSMRLFEQDAQPIQKRARTDALPDIRQNRVKELANVLV
jgi:hypothetical protein